MDPLSIEGPGGGLGNAHLQPMEALPVSMGKKAAGDKLPPQVAAVTITDFGASAFDFIQSMTSDPALAMNVLDPLGQADSMNYKKDVRRMSVISPEHVLSVTFPGFADRREDGVKGTLSDIAEGVGNSPSIPVSPEVRQNPENKSIVEIVEEQNLYAAPVGSLASSVHNDHGTASDDEEEPKAGMLSSMARSWFFRNNRPEDDSPTVEDEPPMVGLGGGRLTSMVVSLLGLDAPDLASEARKMNAWAPQGM